VAAACIALQPQRAQATADDALGRLEAGRLSDARATARRAAELDPLSPDPLFALAAIERSAGRLPAARAALEDAVRRQPAAVDPWLALAQFELGPGGDPARARRAVAAALYLDPRNDTAAQLELEAVRAAAAPAP
jgi:tetratricopeptide (TPR) repeat protein